MINKKELQDIIDESVKTAIKSTDIPANDEILGTDDFQRIYGISKVSQWKMRKAGKLPFHTLGRRIIYRKSEIIPKSV